MALAPAASTTTLKGAAGDAPNEAQLMEAQRSLRPSPGDACLHLVRESARRVRDGAHDEFSEIAAGASTNVCRMRSTS